MKLMTQRWGEEGEGKVGWVGASGYKHVFLRVLRRRSYSIVIAFAFPHAAESMVKYTD